LKLNPEDIRRHYHGLADGELLALDRDDLTDIARGCYDEEIEARGLRSKAARRQTPAEAPPEATTEHEVFDEPVSLGYFGQRESMHARAMLRDAGIPCYVENEFSPYADLTLTGSHRLMVSAARLDEAREALEPLTAESPEIDQEPWDGDIHHQFAQVNGIRMHYAEAGTGRTVLLLHGFPESWHAWRHQLTALAEEGYRVVAPDLRGYGQTERPETLEAYDIFQLTGDIVGLVNAVADGPAVIVGHDWGAWIASCAALLRPDLFCAVALLSVPFVPRREVNQSTWEQREYPGKVFYQAALRSPLAEQFLSSGIRARLLAAFWSLSGDATPDIRWQAARDPGPPPAMPGMPSTLPPWLEAEDLDFLEAEFRRTGFTGGLNYYRNMDRNWELTPFLDGARLLHRALFVAGAKDPVLDFLGGEFEDLELNVPNLWRKVLIPGAGHWIQQERPREVNELLVDFLRDIEAGERGR
jgi:pimeloyl-ACP methyl ester carboxylesterase